MSLPGRPKGEYRSAKHVGRLMSAIGRSKARIPNRAEQRVVR